MEKIKNNKRFIIIISSILIFSIAFVVLSWPAVAKVGRESTEAVVTETVAKLLASEVLEPGAFCESIQLADEDGTLKYVAIYANNGNQTEVKVDAITGVVTSIEEIASAVQD